jgi:hypothetical protein
MALLTLFRVATTDNWADMFEACMLKVGHRAGQQGSAGLGGSGWAA